MPSRDKLSNDAEANSESLVEAALGDLLFDPQYGLRVSLRIDNVKRDLHSIRREVREVLEGYQSVQTAVARRFQ